ncbi:hypothetical protein [Streptomyces peucetius]|uniref:Translation initiation factor IF-2 n=1 Tax=Streptomyces peucetius TaxID=1950 RepID=A0ABY6I6D2_STRPE|nr:hypothetical protein [Streptomyces peucetius]UYQ62566.1 hypothetical protein OGH68_14475 [Streptomyces peucetius]
MKRKSSGRIVVHARNAAMALVALVLLVAGFWSSWGTAQHILLSKGREHGTLAVSRCDERVCTGDYTPRAPSPERAQVTIDKSVAVKKGSTLAVVLKPGTGEAVRTGPAGGLYAWVPLGGALLLAALVIGGGLRLTRIAWGAAIAGGALLTASFLAL